MKTIVFALPGNEELAKSIAKKLQADSGEVVIRQFPDGETYVRVLSEVKGRKAIVVCTLNNPDEKLLPLLFLSKTLKSLGVNSTCLVAPYLAYMRQDKVFNPGEGITSEYFAALISGFADSLITIDPHLHRRHSMSEIYSIPCEVIHASPLISAYINKPIISSYCTASCHKPGGVRANLTTYAGVKAVVDNGTFKDRVVVKKNMPPSGSISATEMDIIKRWLDDGAIE